MFAGLIANGDSTTALPAEYGQIEQTIDPQALQVVGWWALTQSASTGR
jgi:hypothetical protein